MDQRRARFERFHRVVDVWQRLVFDVDHTDRFLGDRFIVRRYRRDGVAAHAHLVVCQYRLIFQPSADEDVLHIRASQDSADALQRLGLRSIDFNDARVRQRSAQHFSPEQTFKRQIRRVLGLPGYFAVPFDARQRFTNGAISHDDDLLISF